MVAIARTNNMRTPSWTDCFQKSELYQPHFHDSTIHDIEARKRDKGGRGHTGINSDGKNKIINQTNKRKR